MKRCHRAIGLLGAAVALAILPRFAVGQEFLGKTLPQWASELDAGKPAQRRAAAFALGKMGAAAALELDRLKRALKDQDPSVREAAAVAIGEIGSALSGDVRARAWGTVGPGLVQLLNETKDKQLLRGAAFAVGGYGPHAEGARAALMKALRDKDPGVRQNAAWAIGRLGPKAGQEGVSSLCRALADDKEDTAVRRDAARALGEIGQPTAGSAIRPLADCCRKDGDGTVRKAAVDALINLCGPEDRSALSELRTLLGHADRDVSRGAALAMGNIGGTEAKPAVPVLSESLRDDEPAVRSLAAAGLAGIGAEAADAVPGLSVALADSEQSVRRNAALALGRIGPGARTAIPQLVRALRPEEPNAEVRRFAAEALAQVGQTRDGELFREIEELLITQALPGLVNALKHDKDSSVRQRSVWALFHVQDPEKARLVEPLTSVLREKPTDDNVMVRYDAARCLGLRMKGRAPETAVDVLLEMLNDEKIKVYYGTGAKVSSGGEGQTGDSRLKVDTGIDARYLAAEALASIGSPKASRADIIAAVNRYLARLNQHLTELEAAQRSPEEPTRRAAAETLPLVRDALSKTTKSLTAIQGP